MVDATRQARVIHAIPGRLRLRLECDGWTDAATDEMVGRLEGLRTIGGLSEVRTNPGARSVVIRYVPSVLTPDQVLAAVSRTGVNLAVSPLPAEEPSRPLVDPALPTVSAPNARMLRGLAISLASLFAARQVGALVGGAVTWPAYFAIWFALRRISDGVSGRGSERSSE